MFKDNIKKFNNKLLKGQSGYTALLMTVLVLTSILTATLSVASIVQSGLSMNWEQVHSVKSLFASEGGMERILYEIRKDPIYDFNDMNDGDCVEFVDIGGGVYDLVTVGTHIQGDPACFGAGDTDKIVLFSNEAEYRLQHNNVVGIMNNITLTSYGAYENQNRVVKSSYSIPLCGPSTAYKPGCMMVEPVNSHDNFNYCVGAGYCYECDYGYKDCTAPIGNDCNTQLGTNLNCTDCGDVCVWPSVCTGIDPVSGGCSDTEILTYCGDGIRQLPNSAGLGGPLNDGFEACDDGNINPNDGCDNCTITSCGDGILQPALEDCEGTNLNWATCVSEGYDLGVLACTVSCTYDYSGCCNENTWTPNTNTECSGDNMYQTNNCGGIQSTVGTKTCNDGNVCTADVCNSTTDTCSYPALLDGTSCGSGRVCLNGSCCLISTWTPTISGQCSGEEFEQTSNCGTTRTVAGTKTCNDSNVCTTDYCNPLTDVCSNVPVFDGISCGVDRVCLGGVCCTEVWSINPATQCAGDFFTQTSCGTTRIFVGTKLCNDNNTCTVDSCISATDVCSYVTLPNGTSCGGGLLCYNGTCSCTISSWTPSAGTQCSSDSFTQTSNCGTTRTVTGTKTCDDSNVCTTDTCVSSTDTCSYTPVANGTSCGVGRTCQSGICVLPSGTLYVNADDRQSSYFNGVFLGSATQWEVVSVYDITPAVNNAIAIYAYDTGHGGWGLSSKLYFGATLFMSTDSIAGWVCTHTAPSGAWTTALYDDSSWNDTVIFTRYANSGGNSLDVRQIWTLEANHEYGQVWCRYKF